MKTTAAALNSVIPINIGIHMKLETDNGINMSFDFRLITPRQLDNEKHHSYPGFRCKNILLNEAGSWAVNKQQVMVNKRHNYAYYAIRTWKNK